MQFGLAAQVGPLEGAGRDRFNPVLEGNSFASGAVTTGHHNRLDSTVEFGDGHLQSHLDRVQTQIAFLPFFGGLEDQGQGHHIGPV